VVTVAVVVVIIRGILPTGSPKDLHAMLARAGVYGREWKCECELGSGCVNVTMKKV
jgi:hypothetical protein